MKDVRIGCGYSAFTLLNSMFGDLGIVVASRM